LQLLMESILGMVVPCRCLKRPRYICLCRQLVWSYIKWSILKNLRRCARDVPLCDVSGLGGHFCFDKPISRAACNFSHCRSQSSNHAL
jgi:hypothetical protein